MTYEHSIADHWGRADVYGLIVAALERASKPLDQLTIEDLAPVDHFHARGFAATVELGDRLPVSAGDRLLDIGCGLGGPARYFARRFACMVQGVDITAPFVDAANRLTALVGMEDRVAVVHGDGRRLPCADSTFDGAYAQHVTMNVDDRAGFFAEARRVLKPGAFFALTEHGRGSGGPLHHPVPWSEDGSGAFLVTPEDTRAMLGAAGFEDIEIEDTGERYATAYRKLLEIAERGALPPLGIHILMGANAIDKVRNAARNIDEGRTHPIQVLCRMPA